MQDYYSLERREIESLLPATASRVLEVGCGAGGTLAWLKRDKYPAAHFVGVEGFESNREPLATVADEAIIADLNGGVPVSGKYDLILALDVLEHLVKPDEIASELAGLLSPTGVLIVSVPNIAHHSVVLPLLLKRRFEYADAGILDRTHLRFFVENTALALVKETGLQVTGKLMNGFAGRKTRLFDALTLGRLRHWLTKQYIIRGERAAPSSTLDWQPVKTSHTAA